MRQWHASHLNPKAGMMVLYNCGETFRTHICLQCAVRIPSGVLRRTKGQIYTESDREARRLLTLMTAPSLFRATELPCNSVHTYYSSQLAPTQ